MSEHNSPLENLTQEEVEMIRAGLRLQEAQWREAIARRRTIDRSWARPGDPVFEVDARILAAFESGLRSTLSAYEKADNLIGDMLGRGQKTLGLRAATEVIR